MPMNRLRELINEYQATDSPTAILVTGPQGSGKTTLVTRALTATKLPLVDLQSHITNPESIISVFHSPKAVILDNLDLYCPLTPSEIETRLIAALVYTLSYTPSLFISTAVSTSLVHPAVLQRIHHVITLDALSYQQRLQASQHFPECAQQIAERTPGFLWSDMIRLFTYLTPISPNDRTKSLPLLLHKVRPALLPTQDITTTNVLQGLEQQVNQLRQVLRAVFPTSNTSTHAALQRIGTFRGVLIHGPTGCGKTTLARTGKQLVTKHTVNFLEISSTEVVGSVIGEGERKLQRLFTTARAIAPCVIIVDNVDIIGPKRRDENAGGAVKAFERVLSTLLVLIDGVIKDDRKVLVIATTRDLQLVDGALLRPGRFDLHIRVHPPNEEARVRIMEEFLASIGMQPIDVGVESNFGALSDGWTAPDIFAYVRKRVLQAKANFI